MAAERARARSTGAPEDQMQARWWKQNTERKEKTEHSKESKGKDRAQQRDRINREQAAKPSQAQHDTREQKLEGEKEDLQERCGIMQLGMRSYSGWRHGTSAAAFARHELPALAAAV